VTSLVFAAVQDEAGAMRRYFLSVTEGLAVVSFPLTIGMALVAREPVPVVLGEKWAFMAHTLQVLAAYASIRSITPIASQALIVMGETRIQMYLGVAAVAGLPTAFYIGSHRGAVGNAVAWSIAHPVFVYIPFTIRARWQRARSAAPAFWR
jgi:PST family polysaccharide transporter